MHNVIKVNLPFEVICIDDTRRPVEIPVEKWIVKDQRYTVINVVRTLDGKAGFQLKEITLGQDTKPFESFNPSRFGLAINHNPDALADELSDLGISVQEEEAYEQIPINNY